MSHGCALLAGQPNMWNNAVHQRRKRLQVVDRAPTTTRVIKAAFSISRLEQLNKKSEPRGIENRQLPSIQQPQIKKRSMTRCASEKNTPMVKVEAKPASKEEVTKQPKITARLTTEMIELKKEADGGNAEAAFAFANILFYGRGIPTDRTSAKYYYEMAANLGHAQAQYQYGDILMSGWGMPKNYSQAFKLFRKAAAQNHYEAIYWQAVCYAEGKGVAKNMTKATALFKKGADLGHCQCQSQYGQACERGNGVDVNREEALKYYRLALCQGDIAARSLFENLMKSDPK